MSKELYDFLSGDLTPRSYSGRGMYGKQCLGVSLDDEGALWALNVELTKAGFEPGPPKIDSMGRGIIAYWPGIKWEAEWEEEEEECPG